MRASTPEHDPLLGTVLAGRYRVLEAIGRGGMGAVYEGVQLDLGRPVALKVLLDADPRAVSRFRQEALANASLHHPNIVQVTDLVVGESEPPFIVMELLNGRSLGATLAAEGAFAPARAAHIAAQLLSALGAAHQAGTVHRDVKPSNVMLLQAEHHRDVVKLVDFGIAKLMGAASHRTTMGAMLGTPAYMAPEQVHRLEPDPRTDIHAVGLVLFEMLTGRRAFPARDVVDLVRAVRDEVPPRVTDLRPEIPTGLAEIVRVAVAKNPAERFPSAAAMLDALRPWTTAPAGELLPASTIAQIAPPTIAESMRYPTGSMAPPTSHALPSTAHVPAPVFVGAPAAASFPAAAPAPAPAPAPANTKLIVAVAVLSTIVVVALIGAGVAFFVMRDTGALAATSSASASAGAAPPSSAAPGAGAPPAATTSKAAAPAANGTTKAPPKTSAAVAPASAVTTSGSKRGCVCREIVGDNFRGGALCETPMVPSCSCEVGGGAGCPVPFDKQGFCPAPARTVFGGVGKKTGETCSAFLSNSASPKSGALECDVCYGNVPTRSGEHRAVCKGFRRDGTAVDGALACPP